jgi:hypothetical protein
MIKMKRCFSTSNRKILYLTMPIVCRKNLSQSELTDCKIKVEEPIPDTLRFRATRESELDMKFFW